MKPFFLFRFRHKAQHRNAEVLVIFVASQDLDEAAFDTALGEDIDKNLSPDQILIVARATAVSKIESGFRLSPRIQALLERLPKSVNIEVVGFNEFGAEVSRTELKSGIRPLRVSFNDFQRRAGTHIFKMRAGFVEATPAYHFTNPSGRHTARFMRLSNILVSGSEVSFLAFCALSFLPADATVAYVDTPALFGLVGAINDHFTGLGIARRLLVDNFRSYDAFKDPKYKFTHSQEAVFLISASSSGSLARDLADYDPMIGGNRLVHLLFLGPRKGSYTAVFDLAKDERYNPAGYEPDQGDHRAGQCPMCARGSVAIPLEGDQFDIAGPRPESVLVGIKDAPAGLGTSMERLVGNSILGVGLGAPRGSAPRQYNIDAPALIKSKSFKERLQYVLARSVPAAAQTVIVLDEMSLPLAKMVARSFSVGTKARLIDKEALRSLPADVTTAPIVIVSAVIESGRSLLDVSRDLRSAYPNAPQIYIVGFAKNETEEKLRSLRATVVQTHSPQLHEFAAIETMVLPLSGLTHAWSRELDLLKRVLRQGQYDLSQFTECIAILHDRLDLLENASSPLVNDLFIANSQGRHLKLQHGFAFWPSGLTAKGGSQADVFFTMSSVLQALRANDAKPGLRALRNGRLQHTLLAPYNFGRFNDGVIQACLLRAGTTQELNYASNPPESREMARIARRILEDASLPRGEAAAEFLVAIASGQLNLCRDDYMSLLEPLQNPPPLIECLMHICRNERLR